MQLLIPTLILVQNIASMPQSTSGTSNGSGILSGNTIGAAVNAPINACGNNIGLGLLNSASGNHCENVSKGSGTDAASGDSS
jgi:hypothetical protein